MGKSVGYARVSTREQNLNTQIIALKQFVSEDMIVTDKATGANLDRIGYQSLKVGIGKLVKGDTLYIKSIDRLSRNKEQAKEELKYFQSIGVRVKVLDIPTTMIDIQNGKEWVIDMVNNILIEVLSSIAENERTTIKQRQAEGIQSMPIGIDGKRYSTKTKKPIGRPNITYPSNWIEIYNQWQAKQITATRAMQILGLKRNSFYKLANAYADKIQ